MTTLSGIDWNQCPAWIGSSVRLQSESLSGIIGIRIPGPRERWGWRGKAASQGPGCTEPERSAGGGRWVEAALGERRDDVPRPSSAPRPRRARASAMKTRQGRDDTDQSARGAARQRGPTTGTPGPSSRYTQDLVVKVAKACVQSGETLFRILYYDCEEFAGSVKLPVSGGIKAYPGAIRSCQTWRGRSWWRCDAAS